MSHRKGNDTESGPVPPNRSHPVWRLFKIAVGVGFVGLGFVGLFLPILQGVLFMLVGLAILGTESRRMRRLLDGIKRRHPGPWRQAQSVKRRLSGWARAWSGRSKEAPGDEGSNG